MAGEGLFEDLPEHPAPKREGPEGEPRLRQPQRDQIELRAVDLEQLLSSEHPARMIWAYVEKLDLSVLYEQIKAREGTPGHPATDPRLLLALWLYATSDGVGSARALARLCDSADAYRWLCGGVSVNHHTLSTFRLEHPQLLDELLAKHVAALSAAGLIDLSCLAQDGLRVRASAGAGSFRRRAKVEERRREAAALVAQLRQEVEQEPEGTERRLRARRERAARERQTAAEAALQKLGELEAEHQRREKTHAKQAAKQGAPRVSLSDPQARKIKMPNGGYQPGYNLQLASAVEQQIIVGIGINASGSDAGLIRPMLEQLKPRGIEPKRYLADGGYTQQADIEWAHQQGIEVYCPPDQSKHGTDPYQPRKKDTPGTVAWRKRMASEDGKAIYKRRAIHECINARLRQWNLRQLTVRGLENALTVLRWFALANNILVGHRLAAATAAA